MMVFYQDDKMEKKIIKKPYTVGTVQNLIEKF